MAYSAWPYSTYSPSVVKNAVETISVHMDLWKWLKRLYFACQASSWRFHFVKKHSNRLQHVIHMLMSPFFTNSRFCCLQTGGKASFSKPCTLKPIFFKSVCFQAPKVPLLCKCTLNPAQYLNLTTTTWLTINNQ